MIKSYFHYLIILTFIFLYQSSNYCQPIQQIEFVCDYFGQDSPSIPEKFAPGFISTAKGNEYGGHFSPNGKEFYFTRYYPDQKAQILFSRYENGRWSEPEPVSFMENFPGAESTLSPDGNKLYYMREVYVEDDINLDFFYSERIGDDWDQPKPVSEINFGTRRVCPAVSANFNLYYSGDYDSPDKKDIYISKFVDGKYQSPINLSFPISSDFSEMHVYIAPDESFILFDSDRPGGFGGTDNYISFKKQNGTWGESINLGEPLNTNTWDWYPYITPDNKHIIFARSDSSGINLFWCNSQIITKLRSEFEN